MQSKNYGRDDLWGEERLFPRYRAKFHVLVASLANSIFSFAMLESETNIVVQYCMNQIIASHVVQSLSRDFSQYTLSVHFPLHVRPLYNLFWMQWRFFNWIGLAITNHTWKFVSPRSVNQKEKWLRRWKALSIENILQRVTLKRAVIDTSANCTQYLSFAVDSVLRFHNITISRTFEVLFY